MSDARVQRRVVRVLVVAQVLGGVGFAAPVAVAALLVEELSGSATLAGLAATSSVLGGAAVALPLAGLSARYGRRWGLGGGLAIGAAGAAAVVAGAQAGLIAVVFLGIAAVGAASAAGLQARYAATDLATPARRARALSTVVWATTVGAVLGPNLAGPSGRSVETLGWMPLVGPFAWAVIALALGTAVLLVALRPDPLLAARERDTAAADPEQPLVVVPRGLGAALGAVRQAPMAVVGLAALVTAHTVMVAVMSLTPVHLRHGGATLQIIGVVISVHIAGMFAFSPAFGWLADRWGGLRTVQLGLAILLAALVVAGTAPSDASAAIGVGLTLLGLGWSACLVAGSALLAGAVPGPRAAGVQGAADLVMQLAGAIGGGLAGVAVGLAGFGVLTAAAAALLLPTVALTLLRSRAEIAP